MSASDKVAAHALLQAMTATNGSSTKRNAFMRRDRCFIQEGVFIESWELIVLRSPSSF
jgi:hypothetical protein